MRESFRRVLFIHHGRTLGGATVSLGILAKQVRDNGFEVRVMLVDPTNEISEYLSARGLEVENLRADVLFKHTTAASVSAFRVINRYKQLRVVWRGESECERILRHLNGWRPDIVHLNSVVLASLVGPLREQQIPLVWHIREAPTRGWFGLRTAWIRKQIRSAQRGVIFIGPEYQRAWANVGEGHVIFNTVDRIFENAGAAHVARRAANGVLSKGSTRKKRPIVFGFLGGVSEIKGTLPLLRAWIGCSWAEDEAKLIIAGLPERHDLSKLASMARRVLPLVGMGTYWQRCEGVMKKNAHTIDRRLFLRDLTSFFSEIDVLLFPATRDHFPRPVIEAAAFGVPMIGSDLPSIRDVVQDEETGLIVPVADVQKWTEAMRRVVTKPDLLQQWGVAAYRLYGELFSTEKGVQSLVEIYKLCLRETRI